MTEFDVEPEVIDASAAKKRGREREAARLRKQRQRQKEAEQKASQAHTAAKSNAEYWEQSRKTLTKEVRDAYVERQDCLMTLLADIRFHLDGTIPEWAIADPGWPVSLDKLIEEVKHEVQRNGTVDWSLVATDCIFKTPAEDRKRRFYSSHERGATESLIEFGFWLALDTKTYFAFFDKFLRKPLSFVYECTTQGCRNPQGKVEKWYCDDCAGKREALRIKDRSKPRMIIDKESFFAPANATFGSEGEWK